jgi:hypothetical protein
MIRTIAVEIPARSHSLMEGLGDGFLDDIKDGHVILDSTKAAKDNIEEAYAAYHLSEVTIKLLYNC